MKILSVDTSSNLCAVAVLNDTKLIKENILDDTKNHSEKILPIIAKTLEEAYVKLDDIDLLVCDKGPGSFTGIRIGVATVMSFVDSLKIPAIGIKSLESLAYNVILDGDTLCEVDSNDICLNKKLLHDVTSNNSILNEKKPSFICPLIDAKNDNVYFELYSFSNNMPLSVIPANCININELVSILSKYDNICFVGDGAVAHKTILCSKINNATFSNYNSISSYSLGIAGLNAFDAGRRDDLLPIYLRKSQAERAKEEC